MFRHKIFFLLVLTLIPFSTSTTLLGQETPIATEIGAAILVLDVFEDLHVFQDLLFEDVDIFEGLLPASESILYLRHNKEALMDEGENCSIPIDGQDSNQWVEGGVSPILGSAVPHGRLVYGHLQQLITAVNGQLVSQIDGSSLVDGWLRDINVYDLPGIDPNLMLVAVDTDGYTTQSMTERIVRTISLLNEEYGIERFVLNMSFGLVPCKDLVELTEEKYAEILMALREADPIFDEFADEFEQLQGTPQLLDLITATGAYAHFSFEAAVLNEIYYITIGRSSFHALMAGLYANEDYRPTISPPGSSSGCDEFTFSNDPLNSTQDPLFRLLVQLNDRCNLGGPPIHEVPPGVVVVPVASAGNMPFKFPFAPGYWPDVLSVSAQYGDLQNCPSPSETTTGRILSRITEGNGLETINELRKKLGLPEVADFDMLRSDLGGNLPPSNSGEVQMNGVYPSVTTDGQDEQPVCYWGTSFAAPRLSFEMAVFLMNGTAPQDCRGGTIGTRSALAFVHNAWDNLPRVEASDKYCLAFNDVLSGFYGTAGMGVSSVNALNLPHHSPYYP